MANRAVDNGELDVSREATSLHNDENWQARLEEARARREVALREKAAGKTAPKKRLKPWEVDGTVGKKPIEPIIQEREDDRIDFADRVQTIREVSKQAESHTDPSLPRRGHNSSAFGTNPEPDLPSAKTRPAISNVTSFPEPAKPPSADEFDEALTTAAQDKPELRDVSLVLPDAPDVSDLAARYASTLAPEAEDVFPEVEEDAPIAVAPEAAAPEATIQQVQKHKRPLALALASMTLAIVPLVNKPPALETGPAMPSMPAFAMQPALGVTWSLQETPVPTRSGEWVPRVSWAPGAPVQPVSGHPAKTVQHVDPLAVPSFGESLQLGAWDNVKPVGLGQSTKLFTPPEADTGISSVTGTFNSADADGPSAGVVDQSTSVFGMTPAKPRPPAIQSVQPEQAPDEASLVMPPKKAPLSDLKVTILLPKTADKQTAASIATDLESQGHRVVRLKDVNYSISARNLRYFYEGDELEAGRLADLYDAELRDFTWYRPKPEVGTTELWLSGKSSNANPVRAGRKVARVPSALQPPTPQRVLPVPTANVQQQRNRGFLSRLFGGHNPQGGQVNARDGGRTASNTVGNTDSSTTTAPSASVDTSADDIDTGVATTATGANAGTDSGTGGATSAGTGATSGGTDAGTSGSGTSGTDAGTGATDAGTGTTDSSSGTDSTGSDSTGSDSTGGSDSGSGDTGGSDTGSSGNNGNGNGNGNGGGKGNSRSGT